MVTQKQNKTMHGLMRGVSWPERHTCLAPHLLQTMLEFTACCQSSSMDIVWVLCVFRKSVCVCVVGVILGWHTLVSLDLFAWISA